MSSVDYSFIGAGIMYLGKSDGSDALRDIGNVTQLQLAVDQEEQVLPNKRACGGGNRNQLTRINGVSLTIAVSDYNAENLAEALYGSQAAQASGAVAAENQTARLGGLVTTDKLIDTTQTVTVTDAGAAETFTEGTDYTVTAAGIVIPATGSAIVEGETIEITYTNLDSNLIQGVTTSGQNRRLVFDGLNDAQSCAPVVVDLFKVKFAPTTGLDLITDDFGSINMSGEILEDASVTGAGLSKYFTINQKQLA